MFGSFEKCKKVEDLETGIRRRVEEIKKKLQDPATSEAEKRDLTIILQALKKRTVEEARSISSGP